MLKAGNRLKLITGLFILLAVIIVGYSGVNLSLLYDAPLIAASAESKLANEKWNRLETFKSRKKDTDWNKSAALLIREENIPEQKPVAETSIPVQETEDIVRYEKETLPVISGIIISSDSDGNTEASAIINSNIYTKNREVAGYMITEITESSVILTKNRKRYHLDVPAVPYSVDQGE